MAEGRLLYFKNNEELENAQVCLERPIILKFLQTNGNEVKAGKSLRYFKAPERTAYPLLLNIGDYEGKLGESEMKCTEIMEKFIIEKEFYNNTDTDRYTVITTRHVLARILTTPFCHFDTTIIIVKHKNLIFISMEDKNVNTDEIRKMLYKFEQYCETDYPTAEPGTNDPADDNEERFFIYGAKLGKFDLFYCGQASTVMSDERIKDLTDMEAINNCQFVLPKLMAKNKMNYYWKTYTALKWWSQSLVSNVENVFIGFKDDKGVVNNPAILKKLDFVMQCQIQRTRCCEGFLQRFLYLALETMSDVDDPDTMYKFHFEPEGDVRFTVHKVGEELPIFSKDFVAYMKRQ